MTWASHTLCVYSSWPVIVSSHCSGIHFCVEVISACIMSSGCSAVVVFVFVELGCRVFETIKIPKLRGCPLDGANNFCVLLYLQIFSSSQTNTVCTGLQIRLLVFRAICLFFVNERAKE